MKKTVDMEKTIDEIDRFYCTMNEWFLAELGKLSPRAIRLIDRGRKRTAALVMALSGIRIKRFKQERRKGGISMTIGIWQFGVLKTQRRFVLKIGLQKFV